MKTCIQLGLQLCRLHQLGCENACVVWQFHWQLSQKQLSLGDIIKYGIQYRRSIKEDHLDCLRATVKEYFPEYIDDMNKMLVLL